MTENDARAFVEAFAAAWASADGNRFLELWHPEGQLHYPFANRIIYGRELKMLHDFQHTHSPDVTWALCGWTWRDDVVVIEWETSNVYGGKTFAWRGVDKLTLKDGKIVEEVVYCDTAPLQAMRRGTSFDALMQLPESEDIMESSPS